MRTILRKRGTKGTALIEFALVVPVLLLILTAGYEAVQYVSLNTKLDNIAAKVAQWTSSDITYANIQDCIIGAGLLDEADNFASYGKVVVSGISASKLGKDPILAWQVGAPSAIVVSGRNRSVLSAPFALAAGAQTIVVEVSYDYVPFFSSLAKLFPPIILYKVAQTVPQNASQFNSMY